MTTLIGIDKLERASPMNSLEETKCSMCGNIIFEKEMYMICQMKTYENRITKNLCCDCFNEKVEQDINRIQNWSAKNINNLINMLAPIQQYMNSDIKKEIDNNRKMLKKIEGENDNINKGETLEFK